MSHDNECITCRSRQKSGEVWIQHKLHETILLCPVCAKDVKGNPDEWNTIKELKGIVEPSEADFFNTIAKRLIDQYGTEGGAEFITEYGVFYFSPNK